MLMPTSTRASWAALAVLGLGALGCQGASAPAAPPAASGADQPLVVQPSAPVTSQTNLATIGLYEYTLSPDTQTMSLSPVRSTSALGDTYTLDLTDAFTTPTFGCTDCLSIETVALDTSGPALLARVGFNVRHPFPEPLLAGRADLHVNNLRLVFLAEGSDSFFGDAGNPQVAGDTGLIANADGYSSLPATFVTPPAGTPNLFPFVVFQTGDNMADPDGNFDAVDGWSNNLSTATGFNVLRQGGEAQTSVDFDLTSGSASLTGVIALVGNYIVSAATRDDRQTPTYFMPEGAMPEPWHVDITPPVGFTAEAADQTLDVIVDAVDWQEGIGIDANFPDPANPGLLSEVGGVAEVSVSIPAFSATSFGPVTTPTGGVGTLSAPLSYTIPVTKPSSYVTEGTIFGLARVVDQRTAFNALQGDLASPAALDDLATYQVFPIVVEPEPFAPCPLGTVAPIPPSQTTNNQSGGTSLFTGDVSKNIVTHGNKIFMLGKRGAAPFTFAIWMSTDRGATWGPGLNIEPAASGGLPGSSLRTASCAVNADGTKFFVVGCRFISGVQGEVLLSRYSYTGNVLAPDLLVAVDLSTHIGPTFDLVTIGDRTDAESLYIAVEEGAAGAKRIRAMRVGNAKTAATGLALTRTRLDAGAAGVAYTGAVDRVDDPDMVQDSEGDIHLVWEPGFNATNDPLAYRQWDASSDTWLGSNADLFGPDFGAYFIDLKEARVVVGPDLRPAIVYQEEADSATFSDAQMIFKAASAAPPYNWSAPIPVDPDFVKTVNGVQAVPDAVVDEATGNIHIVTADYRDSGSGESTAGGTQNSIWETIVDSELGFLAERKLDGAGLADNTGSFRNVRTVYMQNGAPTLPRFLFVWQAESARGVAAQPDLRFQYAECP